MSVRRYAAQTTAYGGRVKSVPWNHRFTGEDQRKREDIHAEFHGRAFGHIELATVWFGLDGGTMDYRNLSRWRLLLMNTDKESDILTAWIADECKVQPGVITKASALFTAYREWCKRTGNHPYTQTKFGRELEARGYRKERPN